MLRPISNLIYGFFQVLGFCAPVTIIDLAMARRATSSTNMVPAVGVANNVPSVVAVNANTLDQADADRRRTIALKALEARLEAQNAQKTRLHVASDMEGQPQEN